MDIDMPGMTGIEGVKLIRQTNAGVKIIMLTFFDDNRNVFDAIRFGANDYLLKKIQPVALIEAIKEVHEGSGCTERFN